MKRSFKLGALSGAMLIVFGFGLLLPSPLLAAKFPEKPITIICPWGTGGATDIAARVFAKHLARVWGVNVNVVNKPGGNTVIGTLELNNSKPDGYTVMMDNRDTTSLPYVADNLPFKVMDRTWMNEIGETPHLLMVPAKSKYNTLEEIITAVRSNPTSFRVPSLGGSGTQDFFMRQFMKAIGVDYKKVSLVMGKSGNDILVFIAQGTVDIGPTSVTPARPFLEAKSVRAIGISGGSEGKRSQFLPSVPTFHELGYPNINAIYWVGLSGPPGLPKALVDTWNETSKKLVLEDKEFRADLEKVGMTPRWRNQQEVIEYVKEQLEISRELWGAPK
jgi:tripartite-type tricarboxylate transporter receptor subunit TctC